MQPWTLNKHNMLQRATARAPVGRNALFRLGLRTVSFWIKINLFLVLNTFDTRQNEWVVMRCVREAVRRGCNMFWADFGYICQWSQWLVWENNPQTLWLICSEVHWETLDFSNLTFPSRWPRGAEMILSLKSWARKVQKVATKFGIFSSSYSHNYRLIKCWLKCNALYAYLVTI